MGKPAPKLEIVGKYSPEDAKTIDWEYWDPSIPERYIPTDSMLEAEWNERQALMDRQRRPVPKLAPPTPKERRATQLEMFKSDHTEVFESDMKFESFTIKPDPKEGTLIGKLSLIVDVPNGAAYDTFGPLLKMQGRFVDVFVGGTTVSTKDLG